MREAESHTARLWPWVATEALGEWTLRLQTASAGGLLKRANSCLATGQPGEPLPDALGRVTEFYRGHGQSPLVQVERDGEVEPEVAAAGWRPVPGDTHFLLAPVARLVGRVAEGDAAITADGPYVTAVVADGGLVLARGAATLDEHWLGIHGLFVETGHRRRGLARQVIAALVAWANRHLARTVWLHVEAGNLPAMALYASLGFAENHGCRYYAPG